MGNDGVGSVRWPVKRTEYVQRQTWHQTVGKNNPMLE